MTDNSGPYSAVINAETVSIRLEELADAACLFLDGVETEAQDAETLGTKNPIAALAFVHRLSLYLSTAHIFLRELGVLRAALDEIIENVRREDIRGQLSNFASEGVDIVAVLQGQGYNSLNDVPPEKFGELMVAVRKAK